MGRTLLSLPPTTSRLVIGGGGGEGEEEGIELEREDVTVVPRDAWFSVQVGE